MKAIEGMDVCLLVGWCTWEIVCVFVFSMGVVVGGGVATL